MKVNGENVKQDRQPYARPQLVKHGQVESLTQGRVRSTSQPCYDDDND